MKLHFGSCSRSSDDQCTQNVVLQVSRSTRRDWQPKAAASRFYFFNYIFPEFSCRDKSHLWWFWDVLDPAKRFLRWFCIAMLCVTFLLNVIHHKVRSCWNWDCIHVSKHLCTRRNHAYNLVLETSVHHLVWTTSPSLISSGSARWLQRDLSLLLITLRSKVVHAILMPNHHWNRFRY